MTWVKACKQYQLQRGEGAKYIVPKKGSDEYEIVKKIFESMEKPPKKEKTKKVAEPIEPPVVIPPIKKTRVKKPSPESDLRKTIRSELIAEMKSKGLSLEVEVV
tara:strand:- start:252 stop:563 length:312 start_codon:yes stop_codon:yes gene_type:complete